MRKFYTISIAMLLILCTLCSCKKSSTQTTSDAGSGDPATVSESSADLAGMREILTNICCHLQLKIDTDND